MLELRIICISDKKHSGTMNIALHGLILWVSSMTLYTYTTGGMGVERVACLGVQNSHILTNKGV